MIDVHAFLVFVQGGPDKINGSSGILALVGGETILVLESNYKHRPKFGVSIFMSNTMFVLFTEKCSNRVYIHIRSDPFR